MKLTIIWRCGACGEPVTPRAGYVHLDMAEMRRYKNQHDAWEQEFMVSVPREQGGCAMPGGGTVMSGGVLLAMPDLAAWKVHHAKCDPDPQDYGYYHFPVPRTWPDLLHWTAHLMEKSWLEETDWSEFTGKILAANGYGRAA